MIPRKILKRKLSAMTVKKAEDIFKTISVLHIRRKFHQFQIAYKYLLALAYQNDLLIQSLSMNNRSLARGIQKEKETSALQLKERLSVESKYFDVLKENSLLKTKLSSLEKFLLQIDEGMKNSMIPNLVKLSDDITTMKLNCDTLKNIVGTTYEIDMNTSRTCSRLNHLALEKKYPLISQMSAPSPILEEAEEEVRLTATRKCKGGLRNMLNMSGLRGDRRIDRSLQVSASNSESSFVESSPVIERKSNTPELEIQSSQTLYNSSKTLILSPVLPVSPAVLLRRVLTPNNSIERIDSNNSCNEENVSDKMVNSFDCSDEGMNRNVSKTRRKRSNFSTFFVDNDENNSHLLITERKKPKRSHYFNSKDENKPCSSGEIRRSSRDSHQSEENSTKIERKRSTFGRISTCSEDHTQIIENNLLGERKKSNRSAIQDDEGFRDRTIIKAERKRSTQMDFTFESETGSDNSLNESRRLRTRSKNVNYKEKSIKVKLRKS